MPKKKKPAAPELPFFRPPLERMMRIHHAIQSGNYPNASNLARELEVSTRSINRDIDFMRDRLGLPIEYKGSRFGYYYTQEVTGFPTLQITEGELFALLVAEKALQQYRGTTFEKPLLSAFQKMTASLPETISLNLADWEQTISFRTSAESLLDLRTFDILAKATAQRKQLLITYRKPGHTEGERRTIDPYHLANINGEWFLFAFDHGRNGIRTFVPARIIDIQLVGKTFARPQKFSLQKSLRDSFGVHSGQGEFLIRIRFDEIVADYIREKKWHPSQELTELPNGSVELCLKLSSLVEIRRWVLGWAGHATVTKPPELAAAVKQAAREILENYALAAREMPAHPHSTSIAR